MTTTTSNAPPEMWQSKLGTRYTKEFMERNESRLRNELETVRHLQHNRVCADCGQNGTMWASVNLGVFLCLTCGSHHRSLGTHISKPKGCTGTYWWGPDEIQQMREIGNARAKELYGDYMPKRRLKDTDTLLWKTYLTDKYVHKKYAVGGGTKADHFEIRQQPSSPTKQSPKKLHPLKNVQSYDAKKVIAEMDLISFEEAESSPKIATQYKPIVSKQLKPQTGPPAAGDTDFFAEFGL